MNRIKIDMYYVPIQINSLDLSETIKQARGSFMKIIEEVRQIQ